MHEQINIRDINISEADCWSLIKHIHDMKSIKVISNNWFAKDYSQVATLYDKITVSLFSVSLLQTNDDNVEEEQEYSYIKKYVANFSRVYRLSLSCSEDTISKLSNLEDFSFAYDILEISGETSKDIEKLTNPLFFKNGVQNLFYISKKNHFITDQIFMNIRQINPNFIKFMNNSKSADSFSNLTRMLSNLCEKTTLAINPSFQVEISKLLFSNVIIKVLNWKREEPFYYSWSKFTYFS